MCVGVLSTAIALAVIYSMSLLTLMNTFEMSVCCCCFGGLQSIFPLEVYQRQTENHLIWQHTSGICPKNPVLPVCHLLSKVRQNIMSKSCEREMTTHSIYNGKIKNNFCILNP